MSAQYPQVEAARAAVAHAPEDPAAHFALAQALDRAGDTAGAIASARVVVDKAPKFAEAHNLLGILLGSRGQSDAAISSFRDALAVRPEYPRAWNNLGNTLKAANRLVEAERAIAEAVRLQPDYQLAQHNLGAIRQGLGRSDDAVAALTESLRLQPEFRPSYVVLAAAERDRGRLDDSIAAYRRAIALDPASLEERVRLAEVLTETGRNEEAQRAYAEALERAPDYLPAALGLHLSLPQVYPNNNTLEALRARFSAGLNAIERELPRFLAGLAPDATLEAWRWSNFFLAYQGRDDRHLQQRYAHMLGRALASKVPGARAPRPAAPREGRRIRVGFVSAFFVDGTVGQYFKRWITGLDRSVFEVCVYHLASRHDAITEELAVHAERFYEGGAASVAAIARAIREDAPDILVYPELGMDTRCVVLAALRLAPVQCAGWGHPVTSGQDTIDCFLTAGAMEPPGAEAHYTERLVRLPGVGTSYPRPLVPQGAAAPSRARLREWMKAPEGAALLICPQAQFKILPSDDALFARVLEAAPNAILVLVEGRHPNTSSQFLRRLAMALDARGVDPRGRVRVLARMSRKDFLQTLSACDAMLDTTAWSGGNTSLDALAAALPIVALPGAQMRARQSAAMLELAGVPELVARDADDYVAIATRLAGDRAWRDALSARIDAGSGRLFDDPEPLRAFAAFLEKAAGGTIG